MKINTSINFFQGYEKLDQSNKSPENNRNDLYDLDLDLTSDGPIDPMPGFAQGTTSCACVSRGCHC